MAGGNWTSMNKILPGAYLNFKSVPRPLMQVGDRGIATIPIELDWGATDRLIEVYSDELLSGDSLAKIGFTAFDEESKIVNVMLQYCYLVKLYRINGAGAKATATIGEDNDVLTITAKYPGIFGNNIIVSVVANGLLYDVSTFVNGAQKHTQTVATIAELENNDYVDFSGTGNLVENAGITLTGGTNGTTPTKATYYPTYLGLLETTSFQTMAAPDLVAEDATLKNNVVTFIRNQRNNEGRYVQGVLADYPTANFEGIISIKNGVIINGVNFTKQDMAAVYAAMTAGASITESNTNKTITGATDLIGKYKNSEQIEAIKNGEVVFVANQLGEITVLEDINTLHTFTTEKSRAFSKNKVLRVLDEIGTTVKTTWERSYMGKLINNADNRDIFRSDLATYVSELENIGAVQNFGGVDDIIVNAGNELDEVLTRVYVTPTDVMEKLYVDCNVIG